MKTKRKTLTTELKITTIFLCAAMIAMWFVFYVNIQNLIHGYVTQNMEQVSEQVLSSLEQNFLKLEEASFALSENGKIIDFLSEENYVTFINKAGSISQELSTIIKDSSIIDNIIVFNEEDNFYRFKGDIDNVSISRLINNIRINKLNKHIQLKLQDSKYIGYVTPISYKDKRLGTIVMLINESSVYSLFHKTTSNPNISVTLSAEDNILLSTKPELIDNNFEQLKLKSRHALHTYVGFTPFELLVSYENSNNTINILFLLAMLLMAVLLILLIKAFLDFWQVKFFTPIQEIINNVEGFEGGKAEVIPPVGVEHFDGLITGINNMVWRIEENEKKIFETAYSLQEAELNAQKALIVSLKKQINAHFTVNVLNAIKALSSSGENEKAGQLCNGLAYLLRYANAGDAYISAMEEFFVLEKYAEIMEIRYPDRFIVDIEMTDELETIALPRMLLQPILENSIVHGLINADSTHPGQVSVLCNIYTDTVSFTISDTGCGMSADVLDRLQRSLANVDSANVQVEGLSHVALENIQRRIQSYYGDGYGISITSTEGLGTTVILTIPKTLCIE